MSKAKAAVDVKGNDFRSRHKPPAKSLDFLASSVPVITNRGSSVDLNLAHRGFPLFYVNDWRAVISADHQQTLARLAALARMRLSADFCSSLLVQLIQQILEWNGTEILKVPRIVP